LVLLLGFRLFAQEVIPPAPTAYFNDYAHAVSAGTAAQLNQTLEDFERQSSEQILVAIYPTMQSDSSIEDYTVRVARSWQVGLKDKNNGAVLFRFRAGPQDVFADRLRTGRRPAGRTLQADH
jgi:uncharacterized protein